MNDFLIPKQTEAESDSFLIECYHDSGMIERLIRDKLSIVSGRKGTGKTALTKFLSSKHNLYSLDTVFRVSIDDINNPSETKIDEILMYLIIKSVQHLTNKGYLNDDSLNFWESFLSQNGLQNIYDFRSFTESAKKNTAGFSIGSIFGKADASVEKDYQRQTISNTVSNIFPSFVQSIKPNVKIMIFIDDISDHLDNTDKQKLLQEIQIIKDFLFRLDKFNSSMVECNKDLNFIACIRDDLFEHMDGSNINKLVNNTLDLVWTEEDFCSLLIKRLPFFKDNREEYLKNPIQSILNQFPNEIFADALKKFNTKNYATNFYAYMVAISFNRPRDFLKFCYALRNRLSNKSPVSFENIDSAEGEYSDYFISELKDELFLSGKLLDYETNIDQIYKLVDVLVIDEGFNFGHLKTIVSSYLKTKTTTGEKKIMLFIKELCFYGVLGFKKEKQENINFKYIKNSDRYLGEHAKSNKFFLHKGLWWFARKRMGREKASW